MKKYNIQTTIEKDIKLIYTLLLQDPLNHLKDFFNKKFTIKQKQ